MPDGAAIAKMFAEVAPRYDRLNRILSCGTDVLWRRAAVRFAGARRGERALDLCCGTGDLSLELAKSGLRVFGADFCAPMVQRAMQKAARRADAPRYVIADALCLPWPDRSFDLVTVAFGIRNTADPGAALQEMARVLVPGGRLVILEFCRPTGRVFGPLYRFYFQRVLPRLGRWLAPQASTAYQYLPDSVQRFPERADFLRLMELAGFQQTHMRLLTGGIAALYRGQIA